MGRLTRGRLLLAQEPHFSEEVTTTATLCRWEAALLPVVLEASCAAPQIPPQHPVRPVVPLPGNFVADA